MKNGLVIFLLCISAASSLNAKNNPNMDYGRLCHEIAWHFALHMQDEFDLTGADMELIYEDTYVDCENWE